MYKRCTAKMMNVIIKVLIHSIFCVLNFMLQTSRPSFTEVFRNTWHLKQAWFKIWLWGINLLIKDEMERRGWKDVWSNLIYLSGMCLKWLRKAKKLTQNKHWLEVWTGTYGKRSYIHLITTYDGHFIDPFTAVSITVSILYFLHSITFPLFSVSFLIVKFFLRHLFYSPSFEFVLFLLLHYLVLLFRLYCIFLFSLFLYLFSLVVILFASYTQQFFDIYN
jgi:hypothetical protein